MLWKTIGALVAVVVVVAIVGFVVLSGDSGQSGGNSIRQVDRQEEKWDGRADRVYQMEIPDSSKTGSLLIERASFSELLTPRATVILRMRYNGASLPSWLRGKKADQNFTALYQGSDDAVRYKLSRGPLEDNQALLDFKIFRVPSVRLNPASQKGLFLAIQGPLRKQQPFFLRVSVTPKTGYSLGSG